MGRVRLVVRGMSQGADVESSTPQVQASLRSSLSAKRVALLAQGKALRILNIGVADHFVKHGTQQEVHRELGLDAQGIIAKVNKFIS